MLEECNMLRELKKMNKSNGLFLLLSVGLIFGISLLSLFMTASPVFAKPDDGIPILVQDGITQNGFEIPYDAQKLEEQDLISQKDLFSDYVQQKKSVLSLVKNGDFYGEKSANLWDYYSEIHPTSTGTIMLRTYTNWSAFNTGVNYDNTIEVVTMDFKGEITNRLWLPPVKPQTDNLGVPNPKTFGNDKASFAVSGSMQNLGDGKFSITYTGQNWIVYEFTVNEKLDIVTNRNRLPNYTATVEGQRYRLYVDGQGKKTVVGYPWYNAGNQNGYVVFDRSTSKKRILKRSKLALGNLTANQRWTMTMGPNFFKEGNDYLSVQGWIEDDHTGSGSAITVWGADDQIKNIFGPKIQTQSYDSFSYQKEISDDDSYYFIGSGSESIDLIRYQRSNDTFSVLKKYPLGSNINLKKNKGKTMIYGYTPKFTGEFLGYGTEASIIIGTVSATFDIESLTLLKTNQAVAVSGIEATP